MFHSLRAACVAAVLLCALPAGMWGQRVCLSGCDGGGKVVQRFDPVAAQRMFDEAFFTIDSLTVAADSLEVMIDSLDAHVDSLEIDRDSLYIRLSRSVVLIDTLLVHVDSLWVLVDTLHAEIDSLQIQLAAVASSGGSGGSGGSSSGGGCGSTPVGLCMWPNLEPLRRSLFHRSHRNSVLVRRKPEGHHILRWHSDSRWLDGRRNGIYRRTGLPLARQCVHLCYQGALLQLVCRNRLPRPLSIGVACSYGYRMANDGGPPGRLVGCRW